MKTKVNYILFIILSAMVISVFCPSVHAENVEEGTIQNVSEDGSMVVMDDGTVYSIKGGDQIDSQQWQAGDQIIMTDEGELVNENQGTEASATEN